MGTFYATGLLYFVWPMLALTLLFSYVWCLIAFALCFGIRQGRAALTASIRKHFFAVFVTSFGCDALLTAAVLVLEVFAQSSPAVAAVLDQPFTSSASTWAAIGCIAAVLLTGVLKAVLYDRIALRRVELVNPASRKARIVILSLLTTPWLFLVPSAYAISVLGEVMVAIGSLMPGEALVE